MWKKTRGSLRAVESQVHCCNFDFLKVVSQFKKKLKGFNVTHSNNTLRDFAVLSDFPNKFTWALSPTRTLCCTEQVETLKYGGSGTELASSVFCVTLGKFMNLSVPPCISVRKWELKRTHKHTKAWHWAWGTVGLASQTHQDLQGSTWARSLCP